MSKVSIIVPVYNNEKYVEKCICSLLNQTLKDIQIVIIDDGSTDKSVEILNSMKEKDERICLVHQENAGVSAARNKGLAIAKGEYITFVDGDDYVQNDYIEQLYNCALRNNKEIVICGLTYVDELGNVLNRIRPGKYVRYQNEEWVFRISVVASHLYKRSLWEKYDITFASGVRAEDVPIALFFSSVCEKICTLKYSGYYYVQHENSAMHNFKGLASYSLPYKAVEDVIKKVRSIGVVNSEEFFELFVLRILSTFLFQLSLGCSKKKMRELCNYITYILNMYFPGYYKNKKAKLSCRIDVPFVQKVAVKMLIILTRTKMIYPISHFFCGKAKDD